MLNLFLRSLIIKIRIMENVFVWADFSLGISAAALVLNAALFDGKRRTRLVWHVFAAVALAFAGYCSLRYMTVSDRVYECLLPAVVLVAAAVLFWIYRLCRLGIAYRADSLEKAAVWSIVLLFSLTAIGVVGVKSSLFYGDNYISYHDEKGSHIAGSVRLTKNGASSVIVITKTGFEKKLDAEETELLTDIMSCALGEKEVSKDFSLLFKNGKVFDLEYGSRRLKVRAENVKNLALFQMELFLGRQGL